LNQWTQSLPGVKVIHADKHFLGFNPYAYNKLFEGNDGGVYWAMNPASNGVWNNVTNGLGITEFYRVAVSNIASYQVAGAQDNGTKFVQFKKYRDAYGGDGMECQMDWADSTTFYASTEYGGISRINLGGGSTNISVSGQTGAWVTPYIVEPMCHNCLLCGYTKVYKSTNRGSNWTAISATFPTLGRVVVAPTDSNTIYATEDGGRYVHITHDGGTTWTSLLVIYASSTISDILVDPLNPYHFWLTYAGYNTNCVIDYNPNRSAVWGVMKYNLPNVPVNCIQIDTSNLNLYIGTDLGVYYKPYDSTVLTWTAFNTGMPVVRVSDLQINYTTGDIWAATYGRSLWSSPKQVNTLGISVVPFTYESLNLYPNPNHGDFSVDFNGMPANGQFNVRLYDMAGKLVWNNILSNNGNNKIAVNTAGLAGGTYLLEIADNAKVIGRNKVIIYR
jgi:hypothetical protein